MPLFPLATVLYPGAPLPLQVFEPRYRQLVEELLGGPEPRRFGVVAIREGHEVGAGSIRSLYDVGCTAEMTEVRRAGDGRYLLMTVGGQRFRLRELDRSRPYLRAEVELLDEPAGAGTEPTAAEVRAAFASYRELLDVPTATVADDLDPTGLSYAVAAGLIVALPERQELLEAPDAGRRLATEARLLAREMQLIRGLRTVPLPQPPLRPGSLN